MTCLHLAAKCGSVDTVKYLVEMTDTDINIKAGFNVVRQPDLILWQENKMQRRKS